MQQTDPGHAGWPFDCCACDDLATESWTKGMKPLLLPLHTGILILAIKASFEGPFFPLTVQVFSSACEQTQTVLRMVPASSGGPQVQYLITLSGLTLLLAGGCLLRMFFWHHVTVKESCMGHSSAVKIVGMFKSPMYLILVLN